jgi:Tfp pilus assembly protein PilF
VRLSYLVLLHCLAAMPALSWNMAQALRPELAEALSHSMKLEQGGEIRKAEQVLVNAIRNAEAVPSDRLGLAIALNNLGLLYLTLDRHADAEQQLVRSIQILKKLKGELVEQVLAKTKLHLAAVYIESGRTGEVDRLNIPEGLRIPKDPEDQAHAKGMLAAFAMARKDMEEAERICLEALSFWMEPSRAPKAQAEIATILNNLGVIALWQGNLEVERTRHQQSLQIWQSILSPKNPTLAKAMANVGTTYLESKQYDEAATWLERAAGTAQMAFGELHPLTVAIQMTWAKALKKCGRKAEASRIFRQAADARRMMPKPSNADYTVSYRQLIENRAPKH